MKSPAKVKPLRYTLRQTLNVLDALKRREREATGSKKEEIKKNVKRFEGLVRLKVRQVYNQVRS